MTSAAKANRNADIVDRLEAEIERLRHGADLHKEAYAKQAEEIARLRTLLENCTGHSGRVRVCERSPSS